MLASDEPLAPSRTGTILILAAVFVDELLPQLETPEALFQMIDLVSREIKFIRRRNSK